VEIIVGDTGAYGIRRSEGAIIASVVLDRERRWYEQSIVKDVVPSQYIDVFVARVVDSDGDDERIAGAGDGPRKLRIRKRAEQSRYDAKKPIM